MIFSSPNLNISLDEQFGSKCIHFEFIGKFTEKISIDACDAWSKYMTDNDDTYTLVWDCSEMEGFEMNARKKWYETMKLLKKRIKFIHVIAGNILVRSAAKVMLGFFGIKGEIVRTMEELHEKVHA